MQLALFTAEALLTIGLLLTLFRLRSYLGLSLVYIALGVFQPLQVQLAATLYGELLPDLLISPGSAVLFTCSLYVVLLVYIREDAREARKVIYGLVFANAVVAAMYLLLGWHLAAPGTHNLLAVPATLYSTEARVMIAGTVMLFLDAILIVIAYEATRRHLKRSLFLRCFVSMTFVLTVDTLGFGLAAFGGNPNLGNLLLAGWVGKVLLGVVFSAALTFYLRFIEPGDLRVASKPLRDLFHALTYREKYEQERDRSQRAIAASDARRKAILESTRDCIFALDATGRVLEANSAVASTFGIARGALLGTDLFEVAFPADAERLRSEILERQQLPDKLLEAVGRRADGEQFPAEIRASAMQLDGQRAIVLSLRDISDRRRLWEQLVQAQKMESVGRLAGGMAHDFNNLLTVILGQAELVKGDADANSEHGQALKDIGEAAERAAALIRQLLAFARKRVLQVMPVDVNELIAQLDTMLRRVIREDIRLDRELAADTGRVLSNRELLEQVLVNLVVNARDAMPLGGTITIDTRRFRGVPAGIDTEPAGWVTISVRDTGAGIRAEHLPRIFEPFFTTKEPGMGTGLGLSMCYGLVTQGGGHITVSSTVDVGSTFTIYLPATTSEPAQDAENSPAAPSMVTGATILIVEDDQLVRDFLALVLKKAGYDVIVATDGEAALERLATTRRVPELLISDVVMPGMRGDELARRVRATNPQVRLLLISGYTDESTDEAVQLPPDAAVLRKPFTPDELLAMVTAAMRNAPSID